MSGVHYPKFVFTGKLSDEQQTFFRQSGFIHFTGFATREQVDEIIRSISEAQAQLVRNNIRKVRGVPVKYGWDVDGKKMIHRFPFTSQFSEPVHRFLQDPRFEELKKLMPAGARIAEEEKDGVVVNHYVNAEGSRFRKMGWHTDSPRDLFLGGRINPMLNVGLYLDDSSEDKGGLRLLPGTHRQGLFLMLFRKFLFVSNGIDKREVLVDAKAGDLVIHDGRMWHRVAQSPLQGEASRRRVMYFPMICGKYEPKDDNSPTPLYHRLLRFVR